MTDERLESNSFYKFLKTKLQSTLCSLPEPYWLVCIPSEESLLDIELTREFARSHILQKSCDSERYTSELLKDTVTYDVVGSEDRSIIWNAEEDGDIIISKAIIINEYLITVRNSVVHIVLLDRRLPSMIEGDIKFIQNPISSINSSKEASHFLKSFCCHDHILKQLCAHIELTKETVLPFGDINDIQSCLHGIMLQYWQDLIKLHVKSLQANSEFQDLLFAALDFYIVDLCHEELWCQIIGRCRAVDQMVKTHGKCLRSVNLSPCHIGLPVEFQTPLPAAIVELASLNSRLSALDRLNCVRDTIELIEAHAKETWASLRQYQESSDTDGYELKISEDELIALLIVTMVKSQCGSLVANIYYMTHFVFSVGDESHVLWHSLCLLKKSLQVMMDIDIRRLSAQEDTLRKELSLQDLMEITTEVENRFDSRRLEGSQSIPDFTAVDLQMHDLTRRLQASTQTLPSSCNSPEIYSDSSSPQTPQRRMSFIEFITSIPSSIRASFRRKQSEQKTFFESSLTK